MVSNADLRGITKSTIRAPVFISSTIQQNISEQSFRTFIHLHNDRCTVILLDGITDVRNVGAIMRSADYFGAHCVVSAKRRTASVESVLAHVSTGSSFNVPIFFDRNINHTITMLKKEDFWIYGAQLRQQSIEWCDFSPKKIALVIGDEHNGLHAKIAEHCDHLFSIPTHRNVDSLNVSVATGIILYELSRCHKDTSKNR